VVERGAVGADYDRQGIHMQGEDDNQRSLMLILSIQHLHTRSSSYK